MLPAKRRQQQIRGLNTESSCWRLYVDYRWSTRRIAAHLNLTAGAVSKALRRGEQRAMAALGSTITVHRMVTLERLEHLYQVAMEGYAASAGERSRKSPRRCDGPRVGEIELVTESAPGDPRFLAEARGTIADMCRLLGLNAPATAQGVESSRPAQHLSDEELERELIQIIKDSHIDRNLLVAALDSDGETSCKVPVNEPQVE